MLFGGIPNYDGVVGDTFYFSHWRYIDYELGEPAVNDLTVFEATNSTPTISATEMPADGSDPGDDDPPPSGCADPTVLVC